MAAVKLIKKGTRLEDDILLIGGQQYRRCDLPKEARGSRAFLQQEAVVLHFLESTRHGAERIAARKSPHSTTEPKDDNAIDEYEEWRRDEEETSTHVSRRPRRVERKQ